jgi:hypothetical protein
MEDSALHIADRECSAGGAAESATLSLGDEQNRPGDRRFHDS